MVHIAWGERLGQQRWGGGGGRGGSICARYVTVTFAIHYLMNTITITITIGANTTSPPSATSRMADPLPHSTSLNGQEGGEDAGDGSPGGPALGGF